MRSVARLFCGDKFVAVVVNERGEVAVKANEGGWGWAVPVEAVEMTVEEKPSAGAVPLADGAAGLKA